MMAKYLIWWYCCDTVYSRLYACCLCATYTNTLKTSHTNNYYHSGARRASVSHLYNQWTAHPILSQFELNASPEMYDFVFLPILVQTFKIFPSNRIGSKKFDKRARKLSFFTAIFWLDWRWSPVNYYCAKANHLTFLVQVEWFRCLHMIFSVKWHGENG